MHTTTEVTTTARIAPHVCSSFTAAPHSLPPFRASQKMHRVPHFSPLLREVGNQRWLAHPSRFLQRVGISIHHAHVKSAPDLPPQTPRLQRSMRSPASA